MRLMRQCLIPAAAGLAALSMPAAALDDVPAYHVTDINSQLAPGNIAFLRGLSENGDAVGEVWIGSTRAAFVYTYEHGPVFLPNIAPWSDAQALDVSNRDAAGVITICGVVGDDFFNGSGVAAYWQYDTTTGAVTAAVEIGALPGYDNSTAPALNNNGKIIGQSVGGDAAPQPMVYDVTSAALTPFAFPAEPTDINDADQVVGGAFRGNLSGSAVSLGAPDAAISASITAINELGWVSATANMPFTDGAGFFVNGGARYTDDWTLFYALSRFDSALDINIHGDVIGRLGAGAAVRPVLYIDALSQIYFIDSLLDPAQPAVNFDFVEAINDNGQIAVGGGAYLLTPLGAMIIPGDVNGDADVNAADLCAFLNDPIDLDGDGDIDADDETWLINRLASLGVIVADCNANGVPDACDIQAGTSADCNSNGVPDECEPDCDLDGIPDDCESDCNANGVPDDCDIASGTSDDCNGNGIPDECDLADTVVAGRTYDPPAFLPADSVYTDDILITDVGPVADVNVNLDIDYRIGNLTVRLIHDGVTITLIDRPGVSPGGGELGNGQLGYRITLDDEGAGPNIETVGNFGSPFEPIESPPAYQPHEPLSTLDGSPRNGVWTIEVETTGFSPVAGLIAWSVEVTDEAVPVGPCPCPGDADADDDVDFDDVNTVLNNWNAINAPGDVNGDGQTNFDDLNEILTNWGGAC